MLFVQGVRKLVFRLCDSLMKRKRLYLWYKCSAIQGFYSIVHVGGNVKQTEWTILYWTPCYQKISEMTWILKNVKQRPNYGCRHFLYNIMSAKKTGKIPQKMLHLAPRHLLDFDSVSDRVKLSQGGILRIGRVRGDV